MNLNKRRKVAIPLLRQFPVAENDFGGRFGTFCLTGKKLTEVFSSGEQLRTRSPATYSACNHDDHDRKARPEAAL
jgi:hypothetical protein